MPMTARAHRQPLPEGSRVGRWIIGKAMATSAFAIVYEAEDAEGGGSQFVLKEHLPLRMATRLTGERAEPIEGVAPEAYEAALNAFVSTFETLEKLMRDGRATGLIPVVDVVRANGTAYVAMRRAEGVPLRSLLPDVERRFDEPALSRLIETLATGLGAAHAAGVRHGDVNPANIWIGEDGTPQLIGFGAAHVDDGAGALPYTAGYAAVERYAPVHPSGPWTDVYGLAATAHHVITGSAPPQVLMRPHGEGGGVAEGDLPGFSRAFLEAVDAGMAILPQARPQSMEAWLARFPGHQAPETGTAAADAARQARATRRALIGSGALVAGAIGLIAWAVVDDRPEVAQAEPPVATVVPPPPAAPAPAAPKPAVPPALLETARIEIAELGAEAGETAGLAAADKERINAALGKTDNAVARKIRAGVETVEKTMAAARARLAKRLPALAAATSVEAVEAARAGAREDSAAVEQERRAMAALLTRAERLQASLAPKQAPPPPVAIAMPRPAPQSADDALEKLAVRNKLLREADEALEDLYGRYNGLVRALDRAYERRRDGDPRNFRAYEQTNKIHRALLRLREKREAIAGTRSDARARRRFEEFENARKEIDRQLTQVRRAI